MAKKEMYPIERKMYEDNLNRLIKSLERSTKMLKRLLFVKYRYDGDSVEQASKRISITKMIGYIWQRRWIHLFFCHENVILISIIMLVINYSYNNIIVYGKIKKYSMK